jgi:hypothetical protein
MPDERLIYVVFYEYDPATRHGYVFFPAGLRNGIGSMSVPFFTVLRESGFTLGACGKALPDHSPQG